MKIKLQSSVVCFGAIFLLASTLSSSAFALLGPVQPWMEPTNGVILPGDIGGPMDIGSGYRWNVPVVTYGFDQSFLDFFGSNGVAAVESAIQVLNDLPPASQLVLTNYPINSQAYNYAAQAESIYDLKSQTLSLLLEQLGLASPTRFTYVLKQWDASLLPPAPNEVSSLFTWPPGAIPEFIIQRNFDPETLQPSFYVNNTLYSAEIFIQTNQYYMVPFGVDPYAPTYNAVADDLLNPGEFYTGLTYDDVGGLAYLLSTNNVNYETLLPGVVGVGTNACSYVNGAWRPGVDKITFIPQLVDSQSGAFRSITNCFKDSYLTNGVLQEQQMARVISQPDFLFSAGDIASASPGIATCIRTGTTNWINNAMENGVTNGDGPGVIQPRVEIKFNKIGPLFSSQPNISGGQPVQISYQYWASFDGSTDAPVVYPTAPTGTNQMVLRMWLTMGNLSERFDWKQESQPGAGFAMQTSTNLVNWKNLFPVTNNGSVCTYLNQNPTGSSRFYRFVPQ